MESRGIRWTAIAILVGSVIGLLGLLAFFVFFWQIDTFFDARTKYGTVVLTAVGVAGGAAATFFAALGAFIAALIAARQLKHQRDIASWNTLREYDKSWNAVIAERSAIVTAARAGTFQMRTYNVDADLLLNQLDAIAFLVNRKTISAEMTWDYWYAGATELWDLMIDYVRYRREDDLLAFAEVDGWIETLRAIEAKALSQAQRRQQPSAG